MIEILDSVEEEKQPSIMVPVGDDMDVADNSPNAVDELAMELATIKQPAKRFRFSKRSLLLRN